MTAEPGSKLGTLAIAYFKGAQTLAALPLARAAPVLVFKADLQPHSLAGCQCPQ